ncbi:MAG: hypothetical protein WCK35_22235 [Chloroflexota bacterium]
MIISIKSLIELGKRADLIVLDGDLLIDITAISRVVCVSQFGKVVFNTLA